MMNESTKKTAGIILGMMKPYPRTIDLPDGGEIHGYLKNGEPVHFKASDGNLFVAIGDVPEYGSPPLSAADALAIVRQAARL